MGRPKKPEGELKVSVTLRVPPQLGAQIKALAVSWDTSPSGVARRLMRRGLLAFEEEDDREFARLFRVWRNLSPENKAHLIAVARSFLKVAAKTGPTERSSSDDSEDWTQGAPVHRTVMDEEHHHK